MRETGFDPLKNSMKTRCFMVRMS